MREVWASIVTMALFGLRAADGKRKELSPLGDGEAGLFWCKNGTLKEALRP